MRKQGGSLIDKAATKGTFSTNLFVFDAYGGLLVPSRSRGARAAVAVVRSNLAYAKQVSACAHRPIVAPALPTANAAAFSRELEAFTTRHAQCGGSASEFQTTLSATCRELPYPTNESNLASRRSTRQAPCLCMQPRPSRKKQTTHLAVSLRRPCLRLRKTQLDIHRLPQRQS